MSYYEGTALTLRTVGTLTSNSGSSTVSLTVNSATQFGDLLIACITTGGNPAGAVDLGDGWKMFSGYDAAGFGLIVAVCKAPVTGASGYSGIGLPSSMGWLTRPRALILPVNHGSQLHLDVANAVQISDFYSATSSSTSITVNPRTIPYSQCVEIVGFGFNNGGNSRTVSSFTNYTEMADAGSTSAPTYNTAFHYRIHTGAISIASSTVTISTGGGTNRSSIAIAIPIIGGTVMPQKNLSFLRDG